eukprot:CAMPEP_0172818342 /NCGR_PEP_ID=MMETSP1075-20121228/13861_1 /TAXON_ID=2916 /ORGANISM="Ceratium fusus, Strain PA161109" /LENGTH=283 /DNA_ID=CAMNT_0013658701 /DNA_START=89 /DNA_END=936 /DNA_ORIENTATION=-
MASREKNASPSADERYSKGFLVGMVVGVSLAGLFNPVDQALYLMILHRRPFLSRANFANPWEGLSQAVFIRTLSGGMFYPLFDVWNGALSKLFPPTILAVPAFTSIAAGQLTGLTNAILMNPMNAVKYQMWGKPMQSMRNTSQQMWKEHGGKAFTTGMGVTALRDAIFGGVYAGARRTINDRLLSPARSCAAATERRHTGLQAAVVDMSAGAMATAISSPLNYARNMKFANLHTQEPPGIKAALAQLGGEVLARHRCEGPFMAASYLQQRLGLGWGAVRVGVG